MKKLFTYLTMALVTVTMFTSCDKLWRDSEDREEAYTLEGTWTGYIDTYIYDRYGLSGDSYRTTMYFERENSYGGWGYEVDYDMYSRYDDYYYFNRIFKKNAGVTPQQYRERHFEQK